MRTSRVLALASLTAAVAGQAAAQTLVNGGFDVQVPGGGASTGWTVSGVDGAGGWRGSGGNPGAFFILNAGGAAGSDPSISQLITDLVVGQEYEVSGTYASWIIASSPANGRSFAADIDGVELFTGTASTIGAWRPFSLTFIASAPSANLRLRAETNSTDNDFAVDSISVALVPSPGSLVLLGAGSVLVTRRRR
jgi:hypothetical protein